MAEEKKSISILLVGDSAAGKSEFILSFVDSEDRKRIKSSGESQTTRTSMIYSIDCTDKKMLSVKLALKEKKNFREERMASFWEELDHNYDNKTNSRIQGMFRKALIGGEDNAFFNHKEFECSDKILKQYNELFSNSFFEEIKRVENDDSQEDTYTVPKEFYEKFCQLKSDNKSDDAHDDIDIEKCLTLFVDWVFEQCSGEIEEFLKDKQIDIKQDTIDISTIDNIECFLKVPEDSGKSFSSLVDKVSVETSVAGYYKDMMEEVGVGEIKFIDTYGLNHEKSTNENLIRDRYQNLFSENPDIETVIYIRRVNAGAPSDLFENIPLLYFVKPSVMAYVCFTHADMLNDNYSNIKAVKEMSKSDSKVYDEIYRKMLGKVNEKMIDLRIKCMLENIVVYCSKVGLDVEYNKYVEQNKNGIKEQNIKGIKSMLSYIRDKKHLGSSLINIDKLSVENIREIINVSSIFSEQPFGTYPSRTIGALGKNLYEGSFLGFASRTQGKNPYPSTYTDTYKRFKYWSDEIFEQVKNRLLDIKKLRKWEDYDDNEVNAIQGLFNEFMNTCIECLNDEGKENKKYFTNNPRSEECQHCNRKDDCIQNVIYEAKKDIIAQRNEYHTRHEWLNVVYDFSSLVKDGNPTCSKLQGIFEQLYQEKFIPSCRVYNARVLAGELNVDMTEGEIDEQIQDYFSKYDRELDENEKIEFEQMVNQIL